MNSEKTIFMKRKGDKYIIHGLFVDDMMHIYSCYAMKDEFLALFKKDFDITGGMFLSYQISLSRSITARLWQSFSLRQHVSGSTFRLQYDHS